MENPARTDVPSVCDILAIDDKPSNLVALEAALGEELRGRLVTVSSGTDALRLLLQRDFAVILLDVEMPIIGGFETARLIRERQRNRHVPIIFMTAYSQTDVQMLTGYQLGAVDFLFRPIVPEILRTKVSVFVELGRQREQIARQAQQLRENERREHERRLAEAEQRWEAEALRRRMAEERAVAAAMSHRAEELARTVAQLERTEEALRHSNQRLRLMADTAGRLLMAPRPEDVLREVLAEVAGHVGARIHAVHRLEGSGEVLVLDPQASSAAARVPALERVTLYGTALGAAALGEAPIYHARGDEEHDHLLTTLGLEAWSAHPLIARGQLLGTVAFGVEQGVTLSADDCAWLHGICDQVAMVMEQARLVDELHRRAAALADADRRKDEFLAVLAHELRNPLSPIVAALHVLGRTERGDPTVRRACDAMSRQVRHLVRLVDDLLDVSRITAGKIELRRTAARLGEVIADAVETSRALLEARGHDLAVDVTVDDLVLHADATRLSQVVANLLNNAAKHSERGGRVLLRAWQSGAEVHLEVQDDGQGIPADLLPRIFDPFVQARHGGGGLGLGLALVQRLVELHGGRVRAESDGPGHGARFRVTLPLTLLPAEASGAGPLAHLPAAPARRVVLIEDDADIRETMAALLQLEGHDVQATDNGEAGVQLVLDAAPDVVLVDIGMPGMDGYATARAIRAAEAGRRTRLVALTGFGRQEDRVRAFEAGFDAHLVKPVDTTSLCAALCEDTDR